jgi:mannose-6-phosphate isomerase-like protein (cupin superfamily)
MESELKEMLASLERTGYCQWMKSEGVPIAEGFSVEDVRELKLSPWRRLGGSGAFVHLYGMEGQTGMYVAEIPAGGALNPERHLYEEMMCILAGHGATEIWQEGGQKRLFEWGPFSLFAPPLNTWHRLVNGGREPVRLMAVTTAPIFTAIRNSSLIVRITLPIAFTAKIIFSRPAKIFMPSVYNRSGKPTSFPTLKKSKSKTTFT